jgi:hypothetical protein
MGENFFLKRQEKILAGGIIEAAAPKGVAKKNLSKE